MDKRVLALIKAFLKAGILTEQGSLERTITGTPQGGILSPLMANVALSALDDHYARTWEAMGQKWHQRDAIRRRGGATYRLIRYADDFVRHEAPYDRAEVKGLRRGPVAAGS